MPDAVVEHVLTFPPNQWPDHNRSHEKTILGMYLYDVQCVRCRVERTIEKRAETQDTSQ